jgi:Flp pilus assembly protein TadG
MNFLTPFRRPRKGRDAGSVAVEFAFTAPLLVLLGIGVADYGGLVASSAALEGSARAGAEVVLANPGVTAAGLTNLGLFQTLFPSQPTPTVSLSPSCKCIDNTNVPTCPPAVNTTPCAGIINPYTSQTDQRVLQYVSVTVTQSSFAPLASYATFVFPSSLSASTLVRRQ